MLKLLRNSFVLLVTLMGVVTQKSSAQLQITTPDTTICPGTSVDLNSIILGTVPINPTFQANDDAYSNTVPIGFTFNFFGNNYSDCVVSLNGYIKFNTAMAGQFSPWTINQAIPGNNNVLNSVMGFYADIFPLMAGSAGTMDYMTVGTAPNRKFVVSFCDCPMFSCTNLTASFQIILYETTNEIEVHIANAPNCPGWNGGAAIEGIQNATGTVAYAVPGRNYPTQWSAVKSSHRWTPTGPNTYSLTAIPYAPIPSVNANINWYANGVTPVGTGGTITVSPNVNTFYVAEAVKCQDTARDTVYVTLGGGPVITNLNPDPTDPNLPAPYAHPTTCGGTDGYINIYGLDSNANYTMQYRKNGVMIPLIAVASGANGVIHIPNLGSGVYDSIIVYNGVCFSNVVGPITLLDPPMVADFTMDLHLGCEGDTLFITNNSIQNVFNVWDFGDGTGDTVASPVHIYPVQGVYTVSLKISNNVCEDSLKQVIDTQHPLSASFTVDDDSSCVGQEVSFTSTSIATGPQYFWSFGDSTTSIDANPKHVFSTPGVYNVMMVVTDNVPCSDTAYMIIKVDSMPYISFVTSDSVLCEGRRINFVGDYLKDGNTGIMWDFGDANGEFGVAEAAHAYDSSGVYSVTFRGTYLNCPDAVFTKDVNITPFPTLNLGGDTTICPNGEAIVLGDFKNQFSTATWNWNTGETTPTIAVRHPGIYTARVQMNGCVTDDSVEVFKDCYLDIPNSFTPNGDGVNDYFLPRQLLSKGVTSFKMSIFNRWGQLVFETTRIDGRGWDGRFNDKEQPAGVYVYMIEAVMKNGVREQYQGNVTLLR